MFESELLIPPPHPHPERPLLLHSCQANTSVVASSSIWLHPGTLPVH